MEVIFILYFLIKFFDFPEKNIGYSKANKTEHEIHRKSKSNKMQIFIDLAKGTI